MAKKKSDFMKEFEKKRKENERKQKAAWQKLRRNISPGRVKTR